MARDLPDLRSLRTADLFQHFGVDVDAEANDRAPLTAIAAEPCSRCGWWRAVGDAGACPACGAPASPPPLSAAPATRPASTANAGPQPGSATP